MTRALTLYPREPRLTRGVLVLAGLLLIQIVLGIGSYVMKVAARDAPQPLLPVVAITTTHVAVGALVLVVSLFVTFQTHRFTAPAGFQTADIGNEKNVMMYEFHG
jgi:hypothetical protein